MELLIPLTQLGNKRRKRRTDEVCPYSKEERAGGGPASKENVKHIVGSLHNGTWLIFIHITENNLAIFSFRVTRKSTVNWSFKQQKKKKEKREAFFLLRNFTFHIKSHNHVWLWWLNAFAGRAISYFGGDVLVLSFHADKGSETIYTQIMGFSFEAREVCYFQQSALNSEHLEQRLSSGKVKELLYNSWLLPCAAPPPHLTLQLQLGHIRWSTEDCSKIEHDQVLWTSIKVICYSRSISLMHLKEYQHLYGFEDMFLEKPRAFDCIMLKQ